MLKNAEDRVRLRRKFTWLVFGKVQCCISQPRFVEQEVLIVYRDDKKTEFCFDNDKESLCSYIGGISRHGKNSKTPDVYNKETIMRFLRKRGFHFE